LLSPRFMIIASKGGFLFHQASGQCGAQQTHRAPTDPPRGRPPKSGVQIRLVDVRYQAQTWDKDRRVVTKIEWYVRGLFPRIGFIVTNPKLSGGKVVKVYSGRGDVGNRIKEGKNTLRWDKTTCHHFAAQQDRLPIGELAFNLLEWLIRHLIKVRAKASYHGRRWYVHVASAFPLASHYRAVFG